MIFFLRRHRRHLGRSVLGLFALALMSATLQPCALAQEQSTPAPQVMDHHAMQHSMVMDHTTMHQEEMPPNHCTSGDDCQTFKAVDNQAAPKAADGVQLFKPHPAALVTFFLMPAQPVLRNTFDRHIALAPIPAPPILEFCVLRI